MKEHAFEDVLLTAKMGAPHASGSIEVSEGTFRSFSSSTMQAQSTLATITSTVGVHRVAAAQVATPLTAATIRFGNVPTQSGRFELLKNRRAVVALIRDDFLQTSRMASTGLLLNTRDLGLGLGEGLPQRGGVTLIRTLDGDGHDRTRGHIHRLLRLVGQMRAAILHLRDSGVWIRRTLPLLVRALLLPQPIQSCQGLPRWCPNPRRLRQAFQKLLIRLPGVPAHDAAHRGIRFQGRRVDRNRLPLEKSRLPQSFLDPAEHLTVRLNIDQSPRPRDRRMIRRLLLQTQTQEAPHRQRVCRSPGHPPLGVQSLEVAHHQKAEVAARLQTRTTQRCGVELAAPRLHESVEPLSVEGSIQARVERVARTSWQFPRRDPQSLLALFAFAHCHARTLRHGHVR